MKILQVIGELPSNFALDQFGRNMASLKDFMAVDRKRDIEEDLALQHLILLKHPKHLQVKL